MMPTFDGLEYCPARSERVVSIGRHWYYRGMRILTPWESWMKEEMFTPGCCALARCESPVNVWRHFPEIVSYFRGSECIKRVSYIHEFVPPSEELILERMKATQHR